MPWHYVKDNQPQGPIPDQLLESWLLSGRLRPDCLIWKEGMAAWKPACDVFELPASLTTPVTPPPIPAPRAEASTEAPFPRWRKAEPPPSLKLRFTGTWKGYYFTWITGVVLTVLTLGLYAPWAKVRNKRYLYAHTRLGDDGFAYTADPRRILIGNLIVAGLFVAWMLSHLIYLWLPFVLIGVGLLFLPWIISRSLRFNARATTWRGLRFGFTGGTWGCLRAFLLLPVASLGVFWPVAARARRRWLVTGHHYGDTPFNYDTSLVELYGIYLKSLLFFAPVGLCYLGLLVRAHIAHQSHLAADGLVYLPSWLNNIAVVGPEILPFMVPVALGGLDFLSARLFTAHWNGTTLGQHTFHAYMAPWDVFKLRLVHTAALTFSLGLLWPWVKIHNHIFKLDCLDFAPAADLGDLTATRSDSSGTSALGDSASDFLDLDIGL